MPTKTLTSKQKTKSTIETIIFIGLCILLFYPPFFRGLYFERELLPTHVFSFILAISWLIYKFKDNQYKLIKTPIDILAIGLVFMYCISIFYGVNTRLAMAEFLKYANYFVIFLLVRDLVKDDKRKSILLNILLLAGVIVTIIGIGSAIGTWNYNGAFVSERISSSFQYPNTLASYLGALFIISLSMIVTEEKKTLKFIYGVASSMMFFTFILTYSRGMWLILPFMILLFIVFVPNKRKLETILYLTETVMISTLGALLFSQNLGGKGYILWGITIIPPIATGGIIYLTSFVENKMRKVSIKKLLVSLLILLVLLAGAILYALNTTTILTLSNNSDKDEWNIVTRNVENIESNHQYTLLVNYEKAIKNDNPYSGRLRVYGVDTEGELKQIEIANITEPEGEVKLDFTTLEDTYGLRIFFDNYYLGTTITFNEAKVIDKISGEIVKDIPLRYKYIPEEIISRITSISLEESSAEGRLTFYQDAFKIIKKYPLLGTGGGGWVTLYQMYQSYLYWTTQAHNFFLQMWIEIGALGIGMFIAMILILSNYAYKKYRELECDNKKLLIVSIFIAVLSLLVHAFMDFDLSLSALTFILWTLIALLINDWDYEKLKNTKLNRNGLIKPIAVLSFAVLMLLSSSLVIGNIYAQKAVEANEQSNIEQAINYFKKASAFDPYKIEYKTDLSTLYKVKYNTTRNKEDILKAKEATDEFLDLARYSSWHNALAASLYLNIGQIDEALELMDKSVNLQPMRVENYLQKSDAYLSAFHYMANVKKDIKKATEIIERVYSIKEEINNINRKAVKPLKYNEDLLYKIGTIQFNYENIKNKEYKIPKGYTLDFAYYFDLDMNNDGKLDKLAVSNSNDGNTKYEVLSEKDNSFIRITNNGESYGLVYPYGLKLEPDTEYKIYFKARGTIKENTFTFFVYDNNAKNRNQGSLTNIKLNEDWKIFELDIKSDSDIKPGTQYLRFQHNGNDSGYIDIEEVMVLKASK